MGNKPIRHRRAMAAWMAACASIAPVWAVGTDGQDAAPGTVESVSTADGAPQLGDELQAGLLASFDGVLPGQQITASAVSPNPMVARALLSFHAASANADEVGDNHEVASALVYTPLVASTLVPGMRVTVVASRNSGDDPRTVYALLEKPGELVSWTRLPLDDLPEAAYVHSPYQTLYLTPSPDGLGRLTAIDHAGRIVGRTDLGSLLPPHAQRTGQPISLVATPAGGACLTVPLACGTLALVETGSGDPNAADEGFRVCSVILSDKHACGVDAWLSKAREMSRAGDSEAAQFALEAAVETDPSDARGYRELAIFHRRNGEPDAEINCLRTGVMRIHEGVDGVADGDWQIGTPAARLSIDYLTAAKAENDPALVQEAVELVLSLYPCLEQAVLLRAELLIEKADTKGAIDVLREALGQVDPNGDLAAAYHDVGRFLCRQGETASALLFLEDAYSLGNQSEFLLRGLATAAASLGQPVRSAEWLSILATQWRSAQVEDSGSDRRERAQKRLSNLELEIETLLAEQ